jgi:hypothetical protein
MDRKIEVSAHGGILRVDFLVVGPEGAVHFWVSPSREDITGDDLYGGVEYHHAFPPDYMRNDPPSHSPCHFLGKPCWHDGTSLWASEHWIPHFITCGQEWVFTQLEILYREALIGDDTN